MTVATSVLAVSVVSLKMAASRPIVAAVLEAIINDLYELSRQLVGPHSIVPWWGWAAWFVTIFAGLLGPGIVAWTPDDGDGGGSGGGKAKGKRT